MIPSSKPTFSNREKKYILKNFEKILNGKSFLSTHIYTKEFESKFANYVGSKYAVASNSGTSALELIFRSIDVSGSEVIIPSNTFIATANAVINAGATPVLADCDSKLCLNYDSVLRSITKKTKAICYVHIGGIVTTDILKIKELCNERNIFLIEDAAQGHGSSINGIKVGNIGDAAAFSFFSTKTMTTGEGGMVTSNNKNIISKMYSMREFGKKPKGVYINNYEYIGYNWRMPEVASIMGISQLRNLDFFIKKRNQIADIYNKILDTDSSHYYIVKPEDGSVSNYYKYTLVLNKNIKRTKLHDLLLKKQISPSGYIYEIPLHRVKVLNPFVKAYENDLSRTENLCKSHFCLPIYPLLTKNDASFIASTCKQILEKIL